MNKLVYIIVLSALLMPEAKAQTSLPFVEKFDPTTPPMGWQLIRKGDPNPFYMWDISSINGYDGNYLFHNYPVGGSAATDDWYVSPPFSFASGGKLDSVRHFFSGFGIPQAGDTVAIYLLQGSSDPALATKTLIHDFRGTNYTADATWNKTSNIVIPATPGTSYLAFRYYTVANWLDVKFDNVGLSGNGVNSVANLYNGADFTIAPNPMTNKFTIKTATSFVWLKLYDAQGRVVRSEHFESVVDISALPSGAYFLELTDGDQKRGFTTIRKN